MDPPWPGKMPRRSGLGKGGVKVAARALGFESLLEMEQTWPQWRTAISRAEGRLKRARGAKLPQDRWDVIFEKITGT